MNSNDIELLRRYVLERSESAFADLVRQHIALVYSAALRQTNGDASLAEDATQVVFTDLARKAARLTRHTSLAGWLYTSTRYAAAALRRAEQRRSAREQEAHAMNQLLQPAGTDPAWEQLRPVLDEAMHDLKADDREAVLLRYFEHLPLAAVGARLGVTENAARMRVDRALDKLRGALAKRGVTSTAGALAVILTAQAASAVPAGLAASISTAAIASAAAATGGAAALTGAALREMLWSKLRLAIGCGAAVLVIATVGVLLKPKPSPVTPPAATSMAKGETRPMSQAAPETAFSEQRQPTREDASDLAPHGPELFFVDDTTGRPITNQVVELSGWERGSQLMVHKQVPLAEARCLAPFDPKHGPRYWILTHMESYADVRLRWQLGQGEVLPEAYTVRLVRPVLIHGRVVDAAGNPVAGATVGFNTENVAATGMSVEDHCVDYLRAKTDANGRWQLNRLAPEMVQRLFGGASHPEHSQSERIYVSRQPELAQQLLDGTLVFHLGEGITLRGTVVDQNQQPIPNAQVHVGIRGSSRSQDTKTGADGTFQVVGCQPGKGLVSAEADGFAPAALQLTFETKLQPVQLALGPGKPLRMRVVDTTGVAVAGATLSLDSFPRQERSVPVPQVQFRCTTDSEGRAVWTHAPDQPLEFTATAPRHIRLDSIKLQPEDKEHVITLQPALVIKGTVRDSATGELIPRFRLRLGWLAKSADGSLEPRWSELDRFCLTFTGGEFRQSLREAVISGIPNPGYVFRFEAEGHTSFVTRVYQPEEGEASLDVQLQPADDIAAVAYLPDGRLARDAQVGFIGPGSDARLVPGGFEGSLGNALASVRRVDANGRFTVPDDKSIEVVVIAHSAGYAEITPGALRKAGAVRLAAWGRIEGVLVAGGQPVTNSQINFHWNKRSTTPPTLQFGSFQTRTDGSGYFVFPQVPPGGCALWSTVSGPEPSRAPVKLAELEVRAGETCQISVGGTNAPANP